MARKCTHTHTLSKIEWVYARSSLTLKYWYIFLFQPFLSFGSLFAAICGQTFFLQPNNFAGNFALQITLSLHLCRGCFSFSRSLVRFLFVVYPSPLSVRHIIYYATKLIQCNDWIEFFRFLFGGFFSQCFYRSLALALVDSVALAPKILQIQVDGNVKFWIKYRLKLCMEKATVSGSNSFCRIFTAEATAKRI